MSPTADIDRRSDLRKITAIVRSDCLEELERRLREPDIPGMSVDEVKGYGECVDFLSRKWISRHARVEIVAPAADVHRIINLITTTVHGVMPGDGIVYVTPVEEAYRIRNYTAQRPKTTT